MSSKLDKCFSIADLRLAAKRRIPAPVFHYMEGAAEDEVTLQQNRSAFDQYQLVPRVLRDVSKVDVSTTILGEASRLPLIMAPTGMSRLFHYKGEDAVSRAADKAGLIYSLSTMSTFSIEEVAAITKGPKWFQIYVWRDRELLKSFIERCRECGYKALCLTVDVPVFGQRERDMRTGVTIPPELTLRSMFDTLMRPQWVWQYLTSPRMELANVRGHSSVSNDAFVLAEYTNAQFDPSVNWDAAAWMVKEWGSDFAIKGILSKEDALRAVDIGATAIIVSNHGGRQLDHSPASFDVLAEIVDAVDGHAEVILDGGVRRGTDVLKALALGARACMIGRAYLYGLGAGGSPGVERALTLLGDEIKRDMALMGLNSLADLDRSCLRRRK
ncbi:MAG: L-lactate dehydrogenase (cytochrome) [Planctomycetota bacterium]|jgi:L-lactate dehydrogenase (cytochrome)